MFVSHRKHCKAFVALTGAALLYAMASPAQAQSVAFGRPTRDCYPATPWPTPDRSTVPGATTREAEPAANPLAFENPDERAAARASVAYVPHNIIGDLISGPALRCSTVSRSVTAPTVQFFNLPPVLVTPPPFTFTPVVTVQPPPVTIQPAPFKLPNGQIVTPPAFQALPAPVTLTFAPTTVTPQPFVATPPPLAITTLQTITLQQQECFEILSAAARASSFKIAEDECVLPVDRVYFGFNYFNNVNKSVNVSLGGFANEIDISRETFGLEKTFLDKRASVEIRVPIATVDVSSNVPGLAGTDTNIGDLSVGLKYAPYLDREAGNAVAVGMVVTAPTGPSDFNPFHSTILQPWVGYLWGFGNFFVQEFCSLAVPTTSKDVTLLFNDVQLGCSVYRNTSPGAWISEIVPTFEVHINTPLNHRGAFRAMNMEDIVATPDWITLTAGTTFELRQRATLAVGGAIPVTGPKPYDFEILAQLNWRF